MNTINIDGKDIPIEGERNLLEVIRKAGIDLPTFCYHSELSVYGACRLCLVQVENRGIVASCSTPPESGLKVKTTTEEIRQMRRISIELLLASHDQGCTTCSKSAACQLQSLARRLGVEKVRFKPAQKHHPVDRSSPSLVRDPNKCILCGDCVRACQEIQGIGAIDFAYRGAGVQVLPAFGKDLNQVECVHCGQCARVCPTGALVPRSEIEGVWKALDNPNKTVIAQIAPAVRVAIGESFGLEPGTSSTGQVVAALRAMGFDRVFDTSFTADMTVLEESNEFLNRVKEGVRLPQFTSCCPGWVRYAEQFYPDLLPNVSSCRSPQQMFGALAKDTLPQQLNIAREDVVVVSIMPCTAKKYEAQLPKFTTNGLRDVDFVLTTQELALMIEEAGLRFGQLPPDSLDMPLGFKTGAGVIFGNTGGVSEAVLRYVVEKVNGVKLDAVDFHAVRGPGGLREAAVDVGGRTVKIGIVHGLRNARRVAEQVGAGVSDYDFIEVMACPGGCVGGAGQPVSRDSNAWAQRARGLYETDKMLQLHKSQENHYVSQCYEQHLGGIGGHKAHELLHTSYQHRRRIMDEALSLGEGVESERISVNVCVGTNCHLRGSQAILRSLLKYIEERDLKSLVDVRASFCFEQCDRGPTVTVQDTVLERSTFERVCSVLEQKIAAFTAGPRTNNHECTSESACAGCLHK